MDDIGLNDSHTGQRTKTLGAFFLFAALLIFNFAGCDTAATKNAIDSATEVPRQADVSAEEILTNVLQQYSQATTYQDKAVLYLTYRLNDRPIQEPHPWSIAWNRKLQFSADWFNAQIRCDGKSFSCYVYDIETGNVDNQQLWLPATSKIPVDVLSKNPIARHFIFGTSELPLDESEAETVNPLVQPMLGFLQVEQMRPWLNAPDKVTRLADEKLDHISCYRIGIVEKGKDYIAWINQTSGIIEQIELPLQYLHSDVLAAQEITRLRLFVRFHEAELNQMIPPKRLLTEQKLAAKSVSRFVELPESLPSEMLGNRVDPLRFIDQAGKPMTFEAGQTSNVLLWLNPTDARQRLNELEDLQKELETNARRVFAIYSDEFVADPTAQSPELALSFANLADSDVPLLFDPELKNSVALKIKAVPCLVVLNGELEVQYARALDESNWAKDAAIAIGRINNGDDVATEMFAQYETYLDEYHQQISLAQPGIVTNKFQADEPAAARKDNKLLWELSSFKDPGNIHVPRDSKYAYVIDGWQTIVKVDIASGREAKRFRLDVPQNAAINRIRSTKTKTNQLRFAAYSLLGKQVFLFDEAFKRIGTFPDADSKFPHDGITQCQWNGNGQSLLCSFIDENGIVNVDVPSGKYSDVLKSPTKTFFQFQQSLLHVVNDRFVIDSKPVVGLESLKAHACYRFTNNSCLLIGSDQKNRWKLVCVNESGSMSWSNLIGDQFFASEIDSLCVAAETPPVAAVASVDGLAQVFDETGQTICKADLTLGSQPVAKGFCVVRIGTQNLMIYSNGTVRCQTLATHLMSSRTTNTDSRR